MLLRYSRYGAVFAGMLAAGLPLAPTAWANGQAPGNRHWVATWQASPQGSDPLIANLLAPPPSYANQTLREIVHISIGGPEIRVRLTNSFSTQSLVLGAVHVADAGDGSTVKPGTDRTVTFGGQGSITVPPGAIAISDPVDLSVQPLSDLAVSIYVPQDTGSATQHTVGEQTSYVTGGDATGAASFPPGAATILARPFLSNVEVLGAKQAAAVVAFGDSITDGFNSTVDANARWPDALARVLVRHYGNRVGVSNAGIGSNRVLNDAVGANALARFDRDVLTQAGVRYVTVLEGINDVSVSSTYAPAQEVSAGQVIGGYRQLIARAHERGLAIYGCTLTPFKGAAFYTDAGEAKREAINGFIRSSGEFDAVIDFDQLIRDPQNTLAILPALDSGDHLHPNDVGYAVMGTSIDPALFRPAEEQD